jgi:hypothetical protein
MVPFSFQLPWCLLPLGPMSTTFKDFKKGTTFDYVGYAQLPAGTWEGSCQLRSPKGLLVGTLAVTITPGETSANPSAIRLLAEADDTRVWAEGLAYGDIRFSDNTGVVLATSDFSIKIIPSRTQPPAAP